MKTLITLIVMIAASALALAQQEGKIAVQLNISGKSGLEGEVRSYFTREFRSISDIDVVDKDAILAVNVVVIENRNKLGTPLGYTISIVITDRTEVISLGLAGAVSTTDANKQKIIMQMVPQSGIMVDHIVQTLDSNSLPQVCKALAAQIDGSNIESVRKFRLKAQKMIQDLQKKSQSSHRMTMRR